MHEVARSFGAVTVATTIPGSRACRHLECLDRARDEANEAIRSWALHGAISQVGPQPQPEPNPAPDSSPDRSPCPDPGRSATPFCWWRATDSSRTPRPRSRRSGISTPSGAPPPTSTPIPHTKALPPTCVTTCREPDGLHMTPFGYRLFGRQLAPRIAEFVARTRCPPGTVLSQVDGRWSVVPSGSSGSAAEA